MRDEGTLSDRAKAIIEEEATWWATRLLQQLLMEKCASIKKLVPLSQDVVAQGNKSSCIGLVDFPQWTLQQIDFPGEIIQKVVGIIQGWHTDVTGLKKEEIVVQAETEAEALAACYLKAFVWSRLIEVTPVDSRCSDARRALAACSIPILEAIDEFSYQLFEATEDEQYEARKGHERCVMLDINRTIHGWKVAMQHFEIEMQSVVERIRNRD